MFSFNLKSTLALFREFSFFPITIKLLIIFTSSYLQFTRSFPFSSEPEQEPVHSDPPPNIEISQHSHVDQQQHQDAVDTDDRSKGSTQNEPVHQEDSSKEKEHGSPRKHMKMFGRNMAGEAGASQSESGKGVLTFGGYRVSDKKRVQRNSVEDTAPGKSKKSKHKEAEANKNKKLTKIDQHCGLGYNWDANEKVCVQIPQGG